ncbi:MAG: acetolactate synthase large subunit [Stappiaceae bacterium]
MNGAESLIQTLIDGGVNVCFANPGTSEMHFVAALDRHPEMRCILCLFEGGVTGAADGYFRMTSEVAATLLHLAPGFGNGFANTHNAGKAGSGVLNIVGDHATYHLKYDAPLRGDVQGISQAVSHWTRSSADAHSVASDGASALRAARSNGGQIATLILPANTAWEDAHGPAPHSEPPALHRPRMDEIVSAAEALKRPGATLMPGGIALHTDLALIAGRIAAKTGCTLRADYFVPRITRGAGTVAMQRLEYAIDGNVDRLSDTTHLVLCGAGLPVAFFAYPGKPSLPVSADCHVIDLCSAQMDVAWTLNALADELDARTGVEPVFTELALPALPTGDMCLSKLAHSLSALMPEDAVVIDESITSGREFLPATEASRRHDWLHLTGGAIGQGLPSAVGAAIACPDRKVIVLTGDGTAMYTLQSLWTMARENLDVTVVVFANRGYQILRAEFEHVGAGEMGKNAMRMFDVDEPLLDWVALAKGHGVEGTRVSDIDAFNAAYRDGLAREEPYLIEVVC